MASSGFAFNFLDSEIEGSLDLILAEFDQKLVEVNRDIKKIRYENEKIKKAINQVGGKEDSHDIRAGINAQLEVTKKTITLTSDNLQFLLQKSTNIPVMVPVSNCMIFTSD